MHVDQDFGGDLPAWEPHIYFVTIHLILGYPSVLVSLMNTHTAIDSARVAASPGATLMWNIENNALFLHEIIPRCSLVRVSRRILPRRVPFLDGEHIKNKLATWVPAVASQV